MIAGLGRDKLGKENSFNMHIDYQPVTKHNVNKKSIEVTTATLGPLLSIRSLQKIHYKFIKSQLTSVDANKVMSFSNTTEK